VEIELLRHRYKSWDDCCFLVWLLAAVAARGEIGREGCEISSLVAGPSPRFSSSGDQKPDGGAKKQKGSTFFKYSIGCMQQPGGQKWKRGGHLFQMGFRAPLAPPLATTLYGWTYGIIALVVFIISGVFSHSSNPNLFKLVIFSCPYWCIENIHFSLLKPNPIA